MGSTRHESSAVFYCIGTYLFHAGSFVLPGSPLHITVSQTSKGGPHHLFPRLGGTAFRLHPGHHDECVIQVLVQRGENMQAVLFAALPGKTTCSPATVSAEGAQFNGRPSPAPNWRGNGGTQY
jgi:hypothetical protein